MKTGDIGTGQWAHARWCGPCDGYHGALYVCDRYPAELQGQVQQAADKHRLNLSDPEWQRRQMERGVPPFVLMIFAALASQK